MNSILEKIPYDKIAGFPGYQRWLAIGMIHVLLFAGCFFFSYKGKLNEKKEMVNNINSIEQELKKNRLRLKVLPELKDKIDKLNFRLLVARTQLPGNKEVPELLEQISNLGRSVGLEFLLFKPQAEIPKDFYTEVPVRMKVSGAFHDITNFFDKLGNFTRIINTNNIKMEGAKREGKKTIIKSLSDLTTFMFIGGKDTEKEGKKSYLNNKFGFSLQYRLDWIVEETNETDSAVLFTFPETKGYRGNMRVMMVNDENGMEKLAALDKKDAGIFKSDYEMISEGGLTIKKFPAYRITSHYTRNKEKLTEMTTYVTKDNKKIFKIIATTAEEDFKNYEPAINEAVDYFWIHSKDDFKTIGEERFWSTPESTYSPTGKRDPFNSLLITAEKAIPKEIIEEDKGERIKTPLEMFDTLSLKLVGIIKDEVKSNTALIETSDGKGYVVKKDTPVGKRRGRIMNITEDSVIVEEMRKYRIGDKIQIKKNIVVLKLRTDEE